MATSVKSSARIVDDSSRETGTASEREIIRAIRSRLGAEHSSARLLLGNGDDAAVLRLGPADAGRRLNATDTALTTDLLVEGVHFDLRMGSLADAAYKALAVSLSDCAAMGARPAFALGQLGVPRGADRPQIDMLMGGVEEALSFAGSSTGAPPELIGGDTVAAPQWILGFTVLGDLAGSAISRGGARPGDSVWVGGDIGLAQCGLNLLWADAQRSRSSRPPSSDSPTACAAQRRPRPQLELGLWLQREGLASAALDLSDSLSQCTLLLAEASGVGVLLDLQQPRLHTEVQAFTAWLSRRRRGPRDAAGALSLPAALDPQGLSRGYADEAAWLLASAEDYGLLFTAPPGATARLLRESPVPLQRLGTVVDGAEGCNYLDSSGRLQALSASGYEHL